MSFFAAANFSKRCFATAIKSSKKRGQWQDEAKRKLFFENLAKQRNCTLQELANTITLRDIQKNGGTSILNYHKRKLSAVFAQLFNITIDKAKSFQVETEQFASSANKLFAKKEACWVLEK